MGKHPAWFLVQRDDTPHLLDDFISVASMIALILLFIRGCLSIPLSLYLPVLVLGCYSVDSHLQRHELQHLLELLVFYLNYCIALLI